MCVCVCVLGHRYHIRVIQYLRLGGGGVQKLAVNTIVYNSHTILFLSVVGEQRRYHSLIAGLLAGAVSAIDKPGRRQTLSLFMTARALGVLVIILNRRGLLPTIPHFVTILFSLCQSLIIVTVTKYPSFLTPSYYRALLRWSQYYTDEKLQVLSHTLCSGSYCRHLPPLPPLPLLSSLPSPPSPPSLSRCTSDSHTQSPATPSSTEAAATRPPSETSTQAYGYSSRSTSLSTPCPLSSSGVASW